MDLSAAFDVVDHNILIDKLKLYGLSNQAVEWFKSYLGDRCQHVMVESQLSCPISVGSTSRKPVRAIVFPNFL